MNSASIQKMGGAALPRDKAHGTWALIRPFWFSEQRHRARAMLALVVLLNLAIVYVNVRINSWFAAFYDAIEKHDFPAFKHLLLVFTVLAVFFILMSTAQIYVRQGLEFRWRQWLTDVYMARWLRSDTYYRLERDHTLDNPDQRIAEDLRSLASNSLALSLDLLSTVVTFFSFVTILWVLSGTLSFTLFGHGASIPGYMVWVAIVYAVVGSWVIQKVSGGLIGVNYRQQRVEADFRVLLVRLRQNAEQIAFYDGGNIEGARARVAFGAIRANWREVMRYTKRLMLASSIYAQAALIFPLMAAAPRYFAGAFTIGVLMRLSDAFGQVSTACSWFINSYSTLADWRATVNRLREFSRRLDEPEASALRLSTGAEVRAAALEVSRPDGRPLAVPTDFTIQPGERWLVRGPSGSGKSTLLRTLAGLWPYAGGEVTMPRNEAGAAGQARLALFLPQVSYVPDGDLKDALCYPDDPQNHDDADCARVLRDCHLEEYVDQLHAREAWSLRLSPGEKQRLSFARALLLKPAFLFLDEATSSLDGDTESALYEALVRQLPHSAIISVAHRDTVARFHTRELRVGPRAGLGNLTGMAHAAA
ncbi:MULTISPECIES: ABC transporter ATP-binding protein/permease [unclassified Achromobacter]|uniref:ABC transporter ATP-binding protein/permease n=1 Tax=unclassified Achromobacter TaxID=2626865 RepID=UPI001E432DCB|nr:MULTISPECIES: ABC transporter ATP-binding protein/permease [unclassified Achromobacter]